MTQRGDYEELTNYVTSINQEFDNLSKYMNFNHKYIEHKEKFFSGRRTVDVGICNFKEFNQNFIFPLWSIQQSKATFLPDIMKIARGFHCHLIVLIDGDRDWCEELSNIEEEMITVADASLNVHIESECSDPQGECVLSWMRLAPDAQYELSITSFTPCGESDQQPTLILDEKDAYGYRFAILRITNWNNGDAPTQKKWATIEALYSRYSLFLNQKLIYSEP